MLKCIASLLEIKGWRSCGACTSTTIFSTTLCGGYIRASSHRCKHTVVVNTQGTRYLFITVHTVHISQCLTAGVGLKFEIFYHRAILGVGFHKTLAVIRFDLFHFVE